MLPRRILIPQGSDSVGLGWGLRLCTLANTFPVGADGPPMLSSVVLDMKGTAGGVIFQQRSCNVRLLLLLLSSRQLCPTLCVTP